MNYFLEYLNLIADNDFILDMAEFSLFTKRVRDEVLKIKTTFPFIRNELAYVGFQIIGIPYDREPRIGGKSNYQGFKGMLRMVKFAVAGILTASTFPLRLIFYIAIPIFLTNLVFLVLNIFGNNNFSSDITSKSFRSDWISIYKKYNYRIKRK